MCAQPYQANEWGDDDGSQLYVIFQNHILLCFSSPDVCYVPEMSAFDQIHLFMYAFFLPNLPCLLILSIVALGFVYKEWNLWKIYRSSRDISNNAA